jgi:hypothetical protein
MPDKNNKSTPLTSNESGRQLTEHAVISRFESMAHAEMAIQALKRSGFSSEAISVRDFSHHDQDNSEQGSAISTTTMVGVQAEGERAAEAWSVLEDIRTQLLAKN